MDVFPSVDKRAGRRRLDLGPIERAVLGHWPIVQTTDIRKELSVIYRCQILLQSQIDLLTSTPAVG
jgi:hypothetical protein